MLLWKSGRLRPRRDLSISIKELLFHSVSVSSACRAMHPDTEAGILNALSTEQFLEAGLPSHWYAKGSILHRWLVAVHMPILLPR